MRTIPPTWAWAKFGDIASVDSNLVDPARYPGLPHIAPNHIESHSGRLLPHQTVREDGVTSSKHLFREGHLLYSKIRPYLAKAVVVGFEGLCSADMYPISTSLDVTFLHWWMLTPEFTTYAAGQQGRSVLPKINQRDLSKLPVPVPPLPEQRRIVAAIEEHFSRLDAAESSLADALARANRLADVAAGALTAGDWPLEPLSDLLVSLRNGIFVSRPSADPPGEPILRISAVRPRALDAADVRFADPPPDRSEDYRIRADDLLFTRYSGNPKYVGACAVVPPSAAGVLHPDKLIRGVVDKTKADPRWISAYVSVGRGRAQIEARLKTTAGQVGISGGQLMTVPVARPSLEEQRRRCDEIDRFTEVAGRSSEAIRSALARSRALRAATLSAAFSGRLVPQDPSDEPASVLLERIAAERAIAKSPRTKKAAS